MNDSGTIKLSTIDSLITDPASGRWIKYNIQRSDQKRRFSRGAKVTSIVLSLLTTPVTAFRDPWNDEQVYRGVITTQIYDVIAGRAISRREALSIVRGILEKAEGERIRIAEMQATKGIQWSNEE